jgi:hypothetical protein
LFPEFSSPQTNQLNTTLDHHAAIMENPPEQPDFDRLHDCLQIATAELQKIQNIPALREGSQILSTLDRMSAQMDQMAQLQTQFQTQIQTQMNSMQAQMQRMEGKLNQL